MGDFDLFNAPVAAAPPAPSASAAPADDFSAFDKPIAPARSFWQRAYDAAAGAPGSVADSFSNFGHTLAKAGKGALGLVSPIDNEGRLHVPFSQLAEAPYRREVERGISDTVTGGLAEKGANAISHAVHEKFPAQVGDFQTTAESDAKAAPEARTLGQVGGTLLKSPFTRFAEGAGGIIPGTGPLADTARGVVGYEASAVPQAATQAAVNAPEGHRLEAAGHAALDAATDPASLVTSAAIPAATTALKDKLVTAGEKAPEIEEAAKRRAVKDLGKDITSAEGVKSRVTDQKRIAEVNDRLYDLADKNPDLRQAFSESAEKALPKIQDFKSKLAEPLDRLYDAIDAKTGGGLDPKQVVGELRGMAKDARRTVAGLADSERLGKLADQFEQVYITEREPLASPAPETKAHGAGNAPPGLTEHLAALEEARKTAKGVAAKALDERIADAKGQLADGAVPTPIDAETTVPEKYVPIRDAARAKVAELEATDPFGDATRAPAASSKIPTRVFRHEVTELLKKSDSVMGGIEGTPRFEALQRLYDAGKQIIDRHIDGSGLPPEQIAQIRDINNGYFLLSRAEGAIESRGFKEANKPGFKFPHSIKQAVHGGGLGAIATAAAMAGPHAAVHALPYIAGASLATHALPAIAKNLNWSLAHGSYGRAVARLTDLARRIPAPEFIGQATRAGISSQAARRIYQAANPPQQGASP